MSTVESSIETALPRRVALLNTDERAGLVAALAAACAERSISLEITTGPGHVVLTFQATDAQVTDLEYALGKIDGVIAVKTYPVISER
jgi:hypothetical protein